MQNLVGIFREEKDLKAALEKLEEFKRRSGKVGVVEGHRMYNPGWHLCRDLQNMLTCAEIVTRAALLRKESRGAHSRLDFPKYDDYWGQHNIVVKKEGGALKVEPRPVVQVE